MKGKISDIARAILRDRVASGGLLDFVAGKDSYKKITDSNGNTYTVTLIGRENRNKIAP